MRIFETIGVAAPNVLLPNTSIDPTKWAVVACDQYTSEPDYWARVDTCVGNEPSTRHLIYPEVFLGEKDPASRVAAIRNAMSTYLTDGVFTEHDGMIYVERVAGPHTRRGLVLCLDLERYDYQKGSTSLIRATEGTIVERLPPRIEIRKGAPIELPHIMVLIDDPNDTVIGPLAEAKTQLDKLYDFELMLNAGHLRGYGIPAGAREIQVITALENLARPEGFSSRYGLPAQTPVLLFAMGDGNHSLATAKAIWEQTKQEAPNRDAVMSDPRRYALVELVNLHDKSLVFEPIHRVVFGLRTDFDIVQDLQANFPGASIQPMASTEALRPAVAKSTASHQRFGLLQGDSTWLVELTHAPTNLAVGSLQNYLDALLKNGVFRELDYVHGTEPVVTLGRKPGNAGFVLPAMAKEELFKTVILDGALPRKTFSMGEAEEKRFYMECRRIDR